MHFPSCRSDYCEKLLSTALRKRQQHSAVPSLVARADDLISISVDFPAPQPPLDGLFYLSFLLPFCNVIHSEFH